MPNNDFNDVVQTLKITSKKYFTIGEVSKICDLQPHVLRYWEKMFSQLKPSKRSGRRYYQQRDLLLVLEIKYLLYDQGYKIPGAIAKLAENESVNDEKPLAFSETITVEDANQMSLEIDKSYVDSSDKTDIILPAINDEIHKRIEDLLEVCKQFRTHIQKNY